MGFVRSILSPVAPSFFPALSDFVPYSPLSARLEEVTKYSNLRLIKPRFKLDQVVCYRSNFQKLNRRRSSCLSSIFVRPRQDSKAGVASTLFHADEAQ